MWDKGCDFVIRFADKAEEKRTNHLIDKMADELNLVANKYGFDLLTYGSWDGFKKTALGEIDVDFRTITK